MSLQAIKLILDRLNTIHEDLLSLADMKKNVLIQNDIDQLNQIVHKEAQLLRQIAECEKDRAHAVGQYLITKGFHPNPNVQISELIKLVFKADDKKMLIEGQQKLLHTIGELKRRNDLNQALIEQSLGFINYSLDLVVGPPVDDVIYQNPLHQGSTMKRHAIFDSRA